MPYSDPAKQAEAQRRYRKKDLRRAREAERKWKQGQRAKLKERSADELDKNPWVCFYRFFTTNACRKKAQFHSITGARWCADHAPQDTDLSPL